MNRVPRRLSLLGVGLVTISGALLAGVPTANAATPYFTGTSACDTTTGVETLTYTVPHPLGAYNTTDISGVTALYTKLGSATTLSAVPISTYAAVVAGDTLTMTVPGDVGGTYRVNLAVGITTDTGADAIVATADAIVTGTCVATPEEVQPTAAVVTTTPGVQGPGAGAPAGPGPGVPTTTAPASTEPPVVGPPSDLPTPSSPTSTAGTEITASSSPSASVANTGVASETGEVEGAAISLAATGSGVDPSVGILGIIALVGGGSILVLRKRS